MCVVQNANGLMGSNAFTEGLTLSVLLLESKAFFLLVFLVFDVILVTSIEIL